jgi:hypothetical protein
MPRLFQRIQSGIVRGQRSLRLILANVQHARARGNLDHRIGGMVGPKMLFR